MTRLADRLIRMAAEGGAAATGAPDYYALERINKEVNAGPYRDCEWFTQFKRQKLKDMGVDSEKLYVSTETSDGSAPNHVVLRVGDYVLDNRQKRPMTMKQMERGGYKVFPGYAPGQAVKK